MISSNQSTVYDINFLSKRNLCGFLLSIRTLISNEIIDKAKYEIFYLLDLLICSMCTRQSLKQQSRKSVGTHLLLYSQKPQENMRIY